MIFLVRICLILMVFVCAGSPAQAGVSIIQALQFGEVISRNNNATHSITINTDGSYSLSGGFIEIAAPQEGIYDIDSLTPSTAIASIVVTQLQPLTASGEVFNMDNFTTTFGSTDAGGVARVTLGARAQTTGTGISYANQTYSGQVQLVISF